MAKCIWVDCDKTTNHTSKLCDMHRRMAPTVVDTLAAGVIGTECYALMSDGEVFLLDAEGNRHKVPESLAKKVRERINAGEALSSTKE